jgi:hypothetical protein
MSVCFFDFLTSPRKTKNGGCRGIINGGYRRNAGALLNNGQRQTRALAHPLTFLSQPSQADFRAGHLLLDSKFKDNPKA